MCRVKVSNVAEGLIPAEKFAQIRTINGPEEVAVSGTLISAKGLRAAFIGKDASRCLIELPNESSSGRRRVWVEAAEISEP